ncbi:uncharacterized protein LOC106154958 [Lingula anatina]|uniref:Uncharacterized protein LOC106154958 n=1 Tax=Lingula anatina TaxID=7574 RepID=A0A1S3HG02_LINAN|nr:uncharacterized protein LOC106154958 [Lingula anatina]|eukprot:XP_013384985.1 uncharacterized protein LOC106154958 [Lingula anatina]
MRRLGRVTGWFLNVTGAENGSCGLMRSNLRCRMCSTVQVKEVVKNATRDTSKEGDKLRSVMRLVPQPVVVVTTAAYDDKSHSWTKRGLTCSSFTSTSLEPPIVSVCVNNPSRFHNTLLQSNYFAVNVLAKNQIKLSVHFSTPAKDGVDQFGTVIHESGIKGTPLINGALAILQCKLHSVHQIGDHNVFYGELLETSTSAEIGEPMLYYRRKYRTIGDEVFMHAFEDKTLPFEDWTHEAHLRMAWNYIREWGKEEAIPLIKKGIKEYNERHKHLISRGYHETITMFYINMISHAMEQSRGTETTFEDFIHQHQYLTDKNLLFEYYSEQLLYTEDAAQRFKIPDKCRLPT